MWGADLLLGEQIPRADGGREVACGGWGGGGGVCVCVRVCVQRQCKCARLCGVSCVYVRVTECV